MTVLAIDPGTEQSAYVLWNGGRVEWFGIESNSALLAHLTHDTGLPNQVVIEQIASYGMPVGAETFETVRWSGRFEQAHVGRWRMNRVALMPRREVKLHLCQSTRAKDANVRQALVDRFGGKDKAIGKKASRGPLYGVTSHCWAALALAVTWFDLQAMGKEPKL